MEDREIKFRVLYKSQKQKFSFIGYERITNGRWEWMCPELNPDKGERWSNGVYPALSRHTYMRNQFIELKDKNGKEIYEGDIMKTVFGNYCVGYDAAQFEFENFDNYGMYGEFPDFEECEVIGNKYENPELLKK